VIRSVSWSSTTTVVRRSKSAYLVDALDRARQLHDDLTAIVERLERRLDQQRAPRDLGP